MMGLRSKLALFVLAGLGAASILPETTPAQQAPASVPRVAKAERAAIAALQNALAARDYATAATALATAQQTATSGDARYYTALLQFRLARETNNAAMQASATEALIAMGRMPQAQLGGLYALQGTGALSARDRLRAAAAYTPRRDARPH